MASTAEGCTVLHAPFSHRRMRKKILNTATVTSRASPAFPPRKHGSSDCEQLNKKEKKMRKPQGFHVMTFMNKFPGTRILINACFTNHLNCYQLPCTCTSTSPCVSTLLFGHVFIFCSLKGEFCSFELRKYMRCPHLSSSPSLPYIRAENVII